MPKIFMCYRRKDTNTTVDELYKLLVAVFGSENVFLDKEDIKPGVTIPKRLLNAIKDSDVVLVIIGTEWLTVTGDDGRRRLENVKDYVRAEVYAGLQGRRIPKIRFLKQWHTTVLPVMVNNAAMPEEKDLPWNIKPLANIKGVVLRPGPEFRADFDNQLRPYLENLDIDYHAETTKYNLKMAIRKALPWPQLITAINFALVLALLFVGVFTLTGGSNDDAPTEVLEREQDPPPPNPVGATVTRALDDRTPPAATTNPSPAATGMGGPVRDQCAQLFKSNGWDQPLFSLPPHRAPYNDGRVYTLYLPAGTVRYQEPEPGQALASAPLLERGKYVNARVVPVLDVAPPSASENVTRFLIEHDKSPAIVVFEGQAFGTVSNSIARAQAGHLSSAPSFNIDDTVLDIVAFGYENTTHHLRVPWLYGIPQMLTGGTWFASSDGRERLGGRIIDGIRRDDRALDFDVLPFANYLPEHTMLAGTWHLHLTNGNRYAVCGVRMVNHTTLEVHYIDATSQLATQTRPAQVNLSEGDYCINIPTNVEECAVAELAEGNRSFLILGMYVAANGLGWYYVKTHDIPIPVWVPATRLLQADVDNSVLPVFHGVGR